MKSKVAARRILCSEFVRHKFSKLHDSIELRLSEFLFETRQISVRSTKLERKRDIDFSRFDCSIRTVLFVFDLLEEIFL